MASVVQVIGVGVFDTLGDLLTGSIAECHAVGLGGTVIQGAPSLLVAGEACGLGEFVDLSADKIVGLWLPDANRWVRFESDTDIDPRTDDYGASLRRDDKDQLLGWYADLSRGMLSIEDFNQKFGELNLPEPAKPEPKDWTDDPGEAEPEDWTDDPGEAAPVETFFGDGGDWSDDPGEEHA